MLCVWCVNGEQVQSIVDDKKNDTNSDEIQMESDGNENTRQTRQLNMGDWTPIPAMWSPRPRSPLNTWWGMPWSFNGQPFVRVHPPSPYWHDYHHYHDDHHHHHVSIRMVFKKKQILIRSG